MNRLIASSTLSNEIKNAQYTNLRVDSIENWKKANIWIEEQSEATVTWEGICTLNALLIGTEGSSLRKSESFIGGLKLPSVLDLGALELCFLGVIAQEEKNFLYRASLIYLWLINCHFFEDANGRTARLVVDWVLSKHKVPPLTFNKLEDCFVYGQLPEDALKVVLSGIENSLAILT